MLVVFAALLALFPFLSAGQYPTQPQYSKTLKSPINPNITISYKSPDPGTCTTTFTNQRQFTGYVNLPPFTLLPTQQGYPINTFFWFVESRTSPETAPLTIFLNGGPGSSSMIGLFQELGPCEVIELADGSFGTQARLWGWDRSSNMLFVDQPSQVGFSYDTLNKMTQDLVRNRFSDDGSDFVTNPRGATLRGTFSSQDTSNTANTTALAAHAVWHFLQGFLSAFPQYNPGARLNSTKISPTGINLFAESYGGIYGPAFAKLFAEKNSLRNKGLIPPNSTLEINLSSLGIINGMVDYVTQVPYSIKFAASNTYGIQAMSTDNMNKALARFEAPVGCKQAVAACRAAGLVRDPEGDGDEESVNEICHNAYFSCQNLENLFRSSGRNYYDIREQLPTSFSSGAYREYLNTAAVQRSIGVPVNYTESNTAVQRAFINTGDQVRVEQIPSLAYLLSQGVRVHLIYGDADYICNWQGGEAISLAVADLLPAYSGNFRSAGYADIITNMTYVGGVVRQYGNLTFSRIYDSGHLVPAYQPETAFTVFTRAITGTDVATGATIDLSTFKSKGPLVSSQRNTTPKQGPSVCWIRDAPLTCSNQQQNQIISGSGIVINGVWYENPTDYSPPATSVMAGKPGYLPTTVTAPPPSTQTPGEDPPPSSVVQTGVYVATGKPIPTRPPSAASNQEIAIKGLCLLAMLNAMTVQLF